MSFMIPSKTPLEYEDASVILNNFAFTKTLNPDFLENIEASIIKRTPVQIELLLEKYIIPKPENIKRFLLSNKDLTEILIDAPKNIYMVFGEVPLYLELHSDPEENWEELFIVIKTNYSPKKAVELEQRLFKEWFIKIMDSVKGRLNFVEEPL